MRGPRSEVRGPRSRCGPGDLGPFLEAVYARYHNLAEVEHDPLRFPRRYTDPLDREVVAFVSAAMAFGRVNAFLAVIETLLGRLGARPAATLASLDDTGRAEAARGLVHRFVGPPQLAGLLAGLGRLARDEGGLKPSFLAGFRAGGDVVAGLASLAGAVRRAAGPDPGFLVASVGPANPAKRLNLFLRWMVRADGLDLGDWLEVPPAALLVPLDVHVFRIAQLLGLLPPRRSGPRLADARALTEALAGFDPDDPVRFDLALSHLGISGACKGRLDRACVDCPLGPVCRARA